MDSAVGGAGLGRGDDSAVVGADTLLRGDRSDEGDLRLTELARRGGPGPAEVECSEFSEALRSRVGVAERESRPLAPGPPFKGLRGVPPAWLLATLGDRLTAGLKEAEAAIGGGLGEERGDLAGEDDDDEAARDSCFRDCERSESPLPSVLWRPFVVDSRLRRGDEAFEALDNTISGRRERKQKSKRRKEVEAERAACRESRASRAKRAKCWRKSR